MYGLQVGRNSWRTADVFSHDLQGRRCFAADLRCPNILRRRSQSSWSERMEDTLVPPLRAHHERSGEPATRHCRQSCRSPKARNGAAGAPVPKGHPLAARAKPPPRTPHPRREQPSHGTSWASILRWCGHGVSWRILVGTEPQLQQSLWCEGLSTVGSRLRMAGSLFEGNDTQ